MIYLVYTISQNWMIPNPLEFLPLMPIIAQSLATSKFLRDSDVWKLV